MIYLETYKIFEKKRYFKKDEIEYWFEMFRFGTDTDTIKEYINDGFDINKKNNFGNTALHYTVNENPDIDIVKLLLELGADPNIISDSDVNPIYYSKIPEITQLLIDAGSEIDMVNEFGQTALFRASYLDGIENIKTLINGGANINIGRNGLRPINQVLSRCMERKLDDSIISYMIDHGSKLDTVTPDRFEYFFDKISKENKNKIIESIFENQPDYGIELIKYGTEIDQKILDKYSHIIESEELGLL